MLSKALTKWPVVVWDQLKEAIDNSLERSGGFRLSQQPEIKELRGKVMWEGDLEQMRLD